MTDRSPPNLVEILTNGLWGNNPALVQLLGLCPLLAVSSSTINGLGLGLATMATLVISNACVSLTRQWLIAEIRIPVFVLLIAGIVTMTGMLMNAWSHQLYLSLGIFIPLIITNCAIMARAEIFASKNTLLPSIVDGFSMGCGFALTLIVLGTARELIGNGTAMTDAHLLFGETARHWQINLPSGYRGLLVAILPPGAFILLGLLLAVKNTFDYKARTDSVTTTSQNTDQHDTASLPSYPTPSSTRTSL